MVNWKYDPKAVGERIRRRRTELGLTQAQLAEQLDRSTKFCADIERGTCGMSINTLMQFSCALQLSPSTLLMGSSLPFATGVDSVQQIMNALAECTEEQKQNILQTIRLFTKRG
jgi:transcriptional regulator with XRE-family HTH domain|nr:MAG TPA: helix-turn-helix domain protein [Caudoviricetes sp.]